MAPVMDGTCDFISGQIFSERLSYLLRGLQPVPAPIVIVYKVYGIQIDFQKNSLLALKSAEGASSMEYRRSFFF